MLDEIQTYAKEADSQMKAAMAHLDHELQKVRAGKASPNLVSDLMVPYYGADTPMNQVANISTADARTILIQPWEKKMLAAIEKAIFEANLGITPQNDGEVVRLTIPPVTEERRKDLVKQAKAMAEDAKVSVRNARRDLIEKIKKAVKNGLSEDMGKKAEDDAQKMTDAYIKQVEDTLGTKEKEILTI